MIKLVYGYLDYHETLAFADDSTAAQEAREIEAIAAARTYGEARRIETRHVSHNPAGWDYTDAEDDEPFDINKVGAVQDGDWPPMMASRAMRLLPEDLLKQFGTMADTTLNGPYMEIPLAQEPAIVAALCERGFEVRRDDALINALDGATIQP
ncbi:hypothetical protein AMIS_60310 [Actinoplanes missouriensis 431]|uniref:Uncharacterized protein n=1 Tax=Actinoplanes missouriensis (strain ATCC 14538 / DSM 43046 / CBS 188.64 / JCM 3121 / NBRC 102363 / NCIMB 12654 / NRRL B-3342 / UNCC 431) TaxID=512565 RepID=I0HE14_ACTM4|nr:hypothetical protein [Actinoplanes missouriensis]BAL91251.1 hypothetical protein AMIS_60310 [Actinoplanes missouriensis 431]